MEAQPATQEMGFLFISLRLHLRSRLHFTRMNRGNAKANARKMKNSRFIPSNQGGVL